MTPRPRLLVRVAALCLALAVAQAAGAEPAAQPKVLRYAFEVAETSLDPVKINDLYSRTLTPHIFEGLYTYDHLARPVKIRPLTANGMPTHSDDYRVWIIKVQPGIYLVNECLRKSMLSGAGCTPTSSAARFCWMQF